MVITSLRAHDDNFKLQKAKQEMLSFIEKFQEQEWHNI